MWSILSNKPKCLLDIEEIFSELSYRKYEWLFNDNCHPPYQKDQYYFDLVGKDGYRVYKKLFLFKIPNQVFKKQPSNKTLTNELKELYVIKFPRF